MNEVYYWWYTYGRFSPGDHNLPHSGEVLSYYIRMSGLSKKEIGDLLPWTERFTQMLLSKKNRSMPESLPRRIFLARTFEIPPILLGLHTVALMQWGDGSPDTSVESASVVATEQIVSSTTIQFYERLLAVSWELYYTSSVEKAAQSIEDCLLLLNQEAAHTPGIKKDQYDALRCRFYQLCSLVERDRLHLEQSLNYEHMAVDIALRLKNAELIAAALLRRARIYIKRKEYILALDDALAALPYAELSRDPLCGKCYQMAGETTSYCADGDRMKQAQSLAYFDRAAKIARKGDLSPDGSFVKTDVTSIFIEKAEAFILFHRFDEAHHALSIARKNLSPEQTRWRVNLSLAEAEAYVAQQEIESCCYCLTEALDLARAVHLVGKEQRVRDLIAICHTVDATHFSVLALEKRLTQVS